MDDNIFEISQEDSLMADPRQGDFITSVHQILTFSISLNFFVPMQTVISICLTMKMKMQGKYFQFRISICVKMFFSLFHTISVIFMETGSRNYVLHSFDYQT